MDIIELNFLKELVNTASPSGFEEQNSKIWREYLKNLDVNNKLSIDNDHYGNSFAVFNPDGEYVMWTY